MTEKLILVDYENVQQFNLESLNVGFQVAIFVGASQKSIPTVLALKAHELGSRVRWHRVEANGKNALDFFIAHELGRIAESGRQQECIVLSKDKGFDPLIRHLNKNGLLCRRINSLLELDPIAEIHGSDTNCKRVVEVLSKSEKKTRPRKRKTLAQHILAMFQNKIDQAEVDRIVDTLFAQKLISESNGALTYEF